MVIAKFYFLWLVLSLIACADEQGMKSATQNISWPMADSLELMHYSDPADQKTYTKKMIHDSLFIQMLYRNLGQKIVQKKECPHNYKMYMFKSGEVFKTLYVSDSCNYLAFARQAEQQFLPLNDSLLKKIKEGW